MNGVDLATALLRALRRLLPASLRHRHGLEMEAMTREVLRAAFRRGWVAGVTAVRAELVDLVRTAWRLAGPIRVLAPATTILGLVLAFQLASPEDASVLEVRFDGHDDAGSFTLVLRDGRAVAASLDGTPVPEHRIRQRGDSVVVLGAGLAPDLRLHLDTPSSIRWQSR